MRGEGVHKIKLWNCETVKLWFVTSVLVLIVNLRFFYQANLFGRVSILEPSGWSTTRDTKKAHPMRCALWSWRESNPCPNEEAECFLHAYLRLQFSCAGKTEATNQRLIRWKSHRHFAARSDYSQYSYTSEPNRLGTRHLRDVLLPRLAQDKDNLLCFSYAARA